MCKFRGLSECPIPGLLKSSLSQIDNRGYKKKKFTDSSDMPLRMYSMSLAPPRSSTTQHLKQELRFTQTDKQPPKCIYLGIYLVFFAEFLYDRGRETFVRDGGVELLQITNRRTNGRNTFSDDVLLSNTDTNMLVNPISRRKVQGDLE